MKYKKTNALKVQGNKKSESQINKLFHWWTDHLMEIYVLFFLCVFPLCLHDKYFDIMGFRFGLFWKGTLVYGFIFLLLGLLYILCDSLYNEGAIRHEFFNRLKQFDCEQVKGLNISDNASYSGKSKTSILGKLKTFSKVLNIKSTDVAMTALIMLFTISTCFSEYPYEAFWGDRGRYQGLLIWLMFYVAYWLVTRFYIFKKWHIWAYMVFASAVCIWGILNFFMLTFGMFEHADDIFMYTFVSSIGNINTYTNFTGILFGVSAAMFISEDKAKTCIFSFIVMVIASFAQIMGLSDNVILSTGIVFAVTPMFFWKSYGNVARYFTAVFTYLGALKITSIISGSGIKTMNDLDPSVQITIGSGKFFTVVPIIVLTIAILFGILAVKEKREKEKSLKRMKMLRFYWGMILALAVVIVVVILLLANNGIRKELWKPYRNFLIFGDSWGTGRGLAWRLGMEYWIKEATLFMKLFGYGPDTYYIITMDNFMNIMQDAGYGMFDSAHNEYFEYFITVGVFGLAAYISVLYLAIRSMLSSVNKYSVIIAIGVIAYAFQAVVNIAIPITTPVFMILMFVGIASCKRDVR